MQQNIKLPHKATHWSIFLGTNTVLNTFHEYFIVQINPLHFGLEKVCEIQILLELTLV